MAGFTYGLAVQSDDAPLRALLDRTPIPGEIELTFRREPSFFLAASAGNDETQTVVCRDAETGELLGFGERSFRRAFIDGAESTVGYLGMLRGAVERRGGLGLARGYRYFRELHAEDPRVPFYLTTILDDNAYAVSVLASGRGGLPTYEEVGRLVTCLIPLRRRHRARSDETTTVRESELPQVVAAVSAWNRRHQFGPVYSVDDLAGRTPLLPGFSWRDTTLVRDGGRILGTLAVWDQSRFKQTVVTGYSGRGRAVRVPYNAYAFVRGLPGLPRPGRNVNTLHVALLTAADDDPAIAAALIAGARARWSAGGYAYLAVGVAEDHPLAPALQRQAARVLRSRVYAVYWPDGAAPAFERGKTLHLETATL